MFTVSNQTKNTELLKGPMAKAICDRLVALQYLGELEVENNLSCGKAREMIHKLKLTQRLKSHKTVTNAKAHIYR